MKICHNCQADQPSDLSTTCMYCGYELKNDSEENKIPDKEKDQLGYSNTKNQTDLDDDLGLESTSDLMQQEAHSNSENSKSNKFDDDLFTPIGQSSPIMPEQDDHDYEDLPKSNLNTDEEVDETGKIKKLSDEELKSIEKNLYSSNNFLNSDDKNELVEKINRKINEEPFDNSPIVPPVSKENKTIPSGSTTNRGSDPAPVQKSLQSKGIAYYYKNYVQFSDHKRLYQDDELTFGKRSYVLKPKDMSKAKLGLFGSIAVLLLLIMAIGVLGGSSSDSGKITGLALDRYDKPYINGADIVLPESGEQTRTNPQGFFQFASISSGTHKIEYYVDDKLVKTDYATIVDNKENLILLRPDQLVDKSTKSSKKIASNNTKVQKPNTKKKSTPTSTKKKSKKKTTQQLSKITLASNIPGAKLVVDGKILGAGNLTYRNLKPGKHNYTVTADGYSTIAGTVSLRPGENKKLQINLSPLAKKETKPKEKDYFYSGKTLYKSGDYRGAVSDLSKTINKYPSKAEAYEYRADSYSAMNIPENAFDDYIKAAEIYNFKKKYNSAIKNYNDALEIDQKSIPAYLGRANVYLNRGNYLAATADFDMVRKFDKRNFDAYFGLGKTAFKQERYKKAVNYFKDARSIDEKNPLVYQYLMLSYFSRDELKNVQKSYDHYKKVVSNDELSQFKKDSKYSSIIRVIELD